jgi:hypothetical protein
VNAIPDSGPPPADPATPRGSREVNEGDSIPWMKARGQIEGACAITSLPDVSEVKLNLSAWRTWFLDAVQLVIGSVPDDSAAIFFQSDIQRDGIWIDKGAMVVRAAEDSRAHVLFHKIVCRLPIPDVILDPGRLPWVRAMGIRAAAHAVRFARDQVGAKLIVDPFCGVGTVLAVANRLGLDALGVERSRQRCEHARKLIVRLEEL